MSLLRIFIGVIVLAIASQITINIPLGVDIPITGQSYMVILIALLCSPLESFICIALYLLIGVLGMPVFADASSGLEKITGGSGGFLYGFLMAASATSWILQKIKKQTFLNILALASFCTLLIIIFGVTHLSFKYGLSKALDYGLYPFWKGAIIKIILATFSYLMIIKLMKPSNENALTPN